MVQGHSQGPCTKLRQGAWGRLRLFSSIGVQNPHLGPVDCDGWQIRLIKDTHTYLL